MSLTIIFSTSAQLLRNKNEDIVRTTDINETVEYEDKEPHR